MNLLKLIKSLFRRPRMFNKPAPITLGKGFLNETALLIALSDQKSAVTAKVQNFYRSKSHLLGHTAPEPLQ